MSKISYIIKRIKKMSYKGLFDTVSLVSKKTKRSKVSIFFDIILCGLKYQAGYVDYNLYEMYKMNKEERATVITRGINNEIIKKYNNKDYNYIFEDKAIFNEKFNKYLKREWIYLKDKSLDDFKAYIKGKKEIIVKPLSLSCGKGVEKININDWKIKDLYEKLINNQQLLVEDVATQHKVINNIYPLSINTIRIVTLNKKVVAAFLRIGTNNNVVDNFNHDGIVTTIDIDEGIINFPAINKNGEVFVSHPNTNENIIGVKIPMWEKVKNMCIEACNIVPEIGYIGWDVCLGEKEPSLIEGNDFPGHDLYQLPAHRNNNYGVLPIFKKAMEDDK